MSAPAGTVRGRPFDLPRIGAFVRRDLLTALSYRTAFVADMATLLAQALVFAYVSKLIDPGRFSVQSGTSSGYLAFVTVGIAVAAFLGLGVGRLNGVIGAERFMGTLEPVLMTPTGLVTLQMGWLAYDFLYVPLRAGLFVVMMALFFGLDFQPGGALPALAFVVAFLPFVWGLGAVNAAATLVFRRGGILTGVGAFGLTFTSGAYFPLELFPGWVQSLARANPVALAVDGARRSLVEGAGWSELVASLALLGGLGAAMALVGTRLFARCLRRELHGGGIGLY